VVDLFVAQGVDAAGLLEVRKNPGKPYLSELRVYSKR
jgi:hypothetical protein